MADGSRTDRTGRGEHGAVLPPHGKVVPEHESRGDQEPQGCADPVHEASPADLAQDELEHPEPDHQQRDHRHHRAQTEHGHQVDPARVQAGAGRRRLLHAPPRKPPDRPANQERADSRKQQRPRPGAGQRRRRHGEGRVDNHAYPGRCRDQGDAGGHQPAALKRGL